MPDLTPVLLDKVTRLWCARKGIQCRSQNPVTVDIHYNEGWGGTDITAGTPDSFDLVICEQVSGEVVCQLETYLDESDVNTKGVLRTALLELFALIPEVQ